MMKISEAPDNHELDKRLAVLEERMNTVQANLGNYILAGLAIMQQNPW